MNIFLQYPDQRLIEHIRILHKTNRSTQLDTTHQSPLTIASPSTITVFRLLARTVNIPATYDTLTHPQSTLSQYITVYKNVATISPVHLATQSDSQPNPLPPLCTTIQKRTSHATDTSPPSMHFPTCNTTPPLSQQTYHATHVSPLPYSIKTYTSIVGTQSYTNQHQTLHPSSPPLNDKIPQPTLLPSLVQTNHNTPSPIIIIPPHVIAAVIQHLNILSYEKQHRNTHISHYTIPLTTTYLYQLAQSGEQANTKPLYTTTIIHYISTIANPTHCQPNRDILLYINSHTHSLTPSLLDHQPTQYIIQFHLNPNIP